MAAGSAVVTSDASAMMLRTQTARSEQPAAVYKTDLQWTTPQAAVARRVSIDIGEGDSQVRITIHERAGDISVKFDSATDALHGQLQSSAGTLVEALQRERVPLMNLDFSAMSGNSTNPDQQRQRQPQPQQQNARSSKTMPQFGPAADDSVSLENNF
jgi:hypothetical protein